MKLKHLLVTVTLLGHFNGSLAAEDSQSSAATFPKAQPIYQADQQRPHVGLLVGTATPEGAYKTSGEVGVDIGYQPYIPFGAGVEISTSEHRNDRDDRIQRTYVMVKGTYNFGGATPIIKDSFVGAGFGPVFKGNGTGVALAPLVGFDLPIYEDNTDVITLGAHAKYLLMDGSDPDSLSVNAAMKYWY